MNLTGTIESAERQFKQILEEFFVSVYDEKSLPSHGIDHHRRVWNNARELLSVKNITRDKYTPQFVSKLIIACYLHDAGMSIDPGVRHGIHSRKLCMKFLSANNTGISDYSDLLNAIGNHDQKDYSVPGDTNNLLTLLSVADDLEAFGFTGIYRYSEIYLKRKMEPGIIGEKVLENASKRFNHFIKTYGSQNKLIMKHIERYNILFSFFLGYNIQVPVYQFNNSDPKGYCGVVELILKMTKNKTDISDLIKLKDKYLYDKVICWFLDGLKSEI